MAPETTTLVNHTRGALWLPKRFRDGNSKNAEKDNVFGDNLCVPGSTKGEGDARTAGRLEGVPHWYLDELFKEKGWARRYERGDVTVGNQRARGARRDRTEVRAEHAEDEVRQLRERVRAAEARASRAAAAEDEARELRQLSREDQERLDALEKRTADRIRQLEAELASALKKTGADPGADTELDAKKTKPAKS